MTRLERRDQALLRILRKQRSAAVIPPIDALPEAPEPKKKGKDKKKRKTRALRPALDFEESEALPYTSPDIHHHISPSRNHHFHLTTWLAENAEDPAVKVSLVGLSDRHC